jgi:hypothetical protein
MGLIGLGTFGKLHLLDGLSAETTALGSSPRSSWSGTSRALWTLMVLDHQRRHRRRVSPQPVRSVRRPAHALAGAEWRGFAVHAERALTVQTDHVDRELRWMLVDRGVRHEAEQRERQAGLLEQDLEFDAATARSRQRRPLGARYLRGLDLAQWRYDVRTDSTALTTSSDSGVVWGRKRATILPSGETRNFSKFHWMSPALPWASGVAVSSV